MMSPEELRELSTQIRAQQRQPDDDLVNQIAADVEEYREYLARDPQQLPPEELRQRLPLMGWLLYEASWDSVQRVVSSFDREGADPDVRARSAAEMDLVNGLVESARRLPWPEFAPRALGALRSSALGESKRDTEDGYDAAWILHEEARTKYAEFRDSLGASELGRTFALSLDEVFLQLALAETGTACRTAERVVARWSEQFADPVGPDLARVEETRWVQRMFRELTAGVEVGERAIETAERIQRDHGFVDQVDEHRLVRRNALQNPGIMTARATSLLLALRPAMQLLGRHPIGFSSWELWEEATIRQFVRAYRVIETEVPGPDGGRAPMEARFQRQLVHIRLNLALLRPGFDLPSAAIADLPCLAVNPLGDAAVEALSAWLGGPRLTGRERGLGAATMPLFIRSLVASRGQAGDDRGYQDWRIKWFTLDQYADETGRLERVKQALAAAA